MADTFRALCAELVELDQAEPGDYANWRQNWNAAIARARAALEAQPEPQGPMPEVDDILRLAAIIRRVDGNHDKGAAALAEAILSHPDSRWQHTQPDQNDKTLKTIRETTPRYRMSVIVSTNDSAIDTRLNVIWQALDLSKEILESVSLPEQLPPLGKQ